MEECGDEIEKEADMGICWSCYWGWTKPVAEIYEKALQALGGDEVPLHYGPAHIVWSDENFDSAEWCLEHFSEHKGDFSESDLAIVRKSLEELVALSLETRCVEPEDYDDEHPKNFPPPDGVEMVKV